MKERWVLLLPALVLAAVALAMWFFGNGVGSNCEPIIVYCDYNGYCTPDGVLP